MASVIVPCKNPDLSNQESTYVTSAVSSGDSSLTVADYEGFADNDYLILGAYGKEKSEMVQVDDASIDSTIDLDASDQPAYGHPAYTKITKSPWDQIKFWRAASESAANDLTTSDTPLGTEDIETDSEYTYYSDTSGSSTSWYRTAFYNSTTSTYSSMSDPIQATGYKTNSRGRMKDMVLSLFGDKNNKWVSETDLDNFFYHVENTIFDFRKRWTFEQEYGTYDLEIGTTKYALDTIASDIKETQKKYVKQVWIENNDPLIYLDRKEMNAQKEGGNWTTVATAVTAGDTTMVVDDVNTLDESGTLLCGGEDDITYTATTESTNTITGIDASDITSAKEVGDEVWQSTEGGEAERYTIYEGNLEIDVPPDETYTLHIDYIKKPSFMDSDGDVSVIPFTNLIVTGVLALCYKAKADDKNYTETWNEFLKTLERKSMDERSGQKQSLVPSSREKYVKGRDYVDFEDSKLKYRVTDST